ncbi:phosphate uptake regulator, PhoU [Archaeoglobales archaeon ex4484_92]|nr:MAG: phosphate uptake regulator, PhoU [Archaeoglobales archaeon ex4484_92]
MDVRKLQLIGGSSYMISLPKEWIRIHNLSQGDEVILHVDENYIRLFPKKYSESERIARAVVKEIPRHDEKFITRFVYALYIQGFDEITIRDKLLSPKFVNKLSEVVRSLIGMEVIDATDNKVVLKCLATSDFDVSGILKRMAQIIKGMMESIEENLRLKSSNEIDEIFKLEEDSDRLYLLAVRQEHRLVKELSSPSKWNELRFVLGIRIIAKLFEEIADLLKDLAIYSTKVEERRLKNELILLLSSIDDTFKDAFDAYSSSDVELSDDVIKRVEEIEQRIWRIISRVENIYYRLALEAMLNICKHIKSIGEIAFNKSVRESLKNV